MRYNIFHIKSEIPLTLEIFRKEQIQSILEKKPYELVAFKLDHTHVNRSAPTVNSEIFARVLFSRNFAYAKFRENKILAKWRNHSVVY